MAIEQRIRNDSGALFVFMDQIVSLPKFSGYFPMKIQKSSSEMESNSRLDDKVKVVYRKSTKLQSVKTAILILFSKIF